VVYNSALVSGFQRDDPMNFTLIENSVSTAEVPVSMPTVCLQFAFEVGGLRLGVPVIEDIIPMPLCLFISLSPIQSSFSFGLRHHSSRSLSFSIYPLSLILRAGLCKNVFRDDSRRVDPICSNPHRPL
jgi:hypothetical protein